MTVCRLHQIESTSGLRIDWTADGTITLHPSHLIPSVEYEPLVYSNTDFDALPVALQNSPTTFCIDEALVDTTTGPQAVPAAEAPQHFTHKHQIDLGALEELQASRPLLRVLRLFFTMFTDDFGTYNKVQHKTNGKYVSLGNLPYAMQCLLKNVLALTLAPPGTPPEVASKAFAAGLQEFKTPRVMDLGPKLGEVIVLGGLGVLFVDTPEGQDIIGCKRQNCDFGCRQCMCPKTHTDDLEANFPIRTDFNMASVSSCFPSFSFTILNLPMSSCTRRCIVRLVHPARIRRRSFCKQQACMSEGSCSLISLSTSGKWFPTTYSTSW